MMLMIRTWVIPFINDLIKSQGMAISVLAGGLLWFMYVDYKNQAAQALKMQLLEQKVDNCHIELVQMLNTERKELILILGKVSESIDEFNQEQERIRHERIK